MEIEQSIHTLFINRHLTLSVAESCTGGRLAASLTRLPGSSHYFLGGVVAYSNQLKKELLNVPETILRDCGAVSRETVGVMAQSILEISGSDVSVAVSGIAGPDGGTSEKPVGTIWAAIGQSGMEPYTWSFTVHGDREFIMEKSAAIILEKLFDIVKG